MKYFCYISSRKIEDLYSQLDQGGITDSQITREINAEAGLETANETSVLSLLGLNVNFGAQGKLQYGQSMKKQLSQKLKEVIRTLINQNEICDIKKILLKEFSGESFFYYTGEFHFDDSPDFDIDELDYVDGIAILTSRLEGLWQSLDEYNLKLACSAAYFSDTRANGKYQINSGNYFFFQQNGTLKLETIFIKSGIDTEGHAILGSPLFLALENGDSWI